MSSRRLCIPVVALLLAGCGEAPLAPRPGAEETVDRAFLAAAAAQPVINEFVANHAGTDTHEFVEVFGAPLTDYSAYTVLQIEGDGTGAGIIDSAHRVGTTDANGFWTTGFVTNGLENGTMTLLLVRNFTGAVGQDLDTDRTACWMPRPGRRSPMRSRSRTVVRTTARMACRCLFWAQPSRDSYRSRTHAPMMPIPHVAGEPGVVRQERPDPLRQGEYPLPDG